MPHYDEQLLHYGFALALNQLFVTIKPVENLSSLKFSGSSEIPDITPAPEQARVLSISCKPDMGFTVSILGDLRIGNHFNLRFIPSFIYGSTAILYTIEELNMNPSTMKIDTIIESITKEIPSTYINFPLEIKFKAVRYNNFRPYLMVGAQYSLDLSSNAKKRAEPGQVQFKQSDFYLAGGVGCDLYNEWFKLGIELKMMYGLNDKLAHKGTIYTETISNLQSKIFQLSVTFE